MGFRSMMISESTTLTATAEFVEKWRAVGYWVNEHPGCFAIATSTERKFYEATNDLFRDIQGLLKNPETNTYKSRYVELILFHECGGVEKVTIFKDLIQWTRLEFGTEWIDIDGPTHSYCYGCSDSPVLARNKDMAE
jgi:hypothetical protein